MPAPSPNPRVSPFVADRGMTERVAVLIDCDNTSWRLGTAILAEAAKVGTLGVKRGYGDWSSSYLSGWKSELSTLAVQPIQQPAYVTGKNASDSALIIDAMDLLYAGNVDVFFLVSSDSDFTRLAMRLRESGRRVHGIGAQKTPVSFQNACDRFTFTEVLGRPDAATEPEQQVLDSSSVPDLSAVLTTAVTATAREDGWAHLGTVGAYIVTNNPTFDSRNYGHARLGSLVRATNTVEVKNVAGPDGHEQPWIRLRRG